MQRAFTVCFLLAVTVASALAGPPTDLLTAVRSKAVALSPAALGGLSVDNLQCQLQNLTQREITVAIEPGLHFQAHDPEAQDLLTYQPLLVVLAPHATRKVKLQGFCMQLRKHAPRAAAPFVLLGFARPAVKGLADSLAKYPGLAPEYGQMLVWALTDQKDLHPMLVTPALLRGGQNTMRYVSQQAGMSLARVTAYGRGQKPFPTVKTFSKSSYLLYHVPTAQVLSLKMFDPDGNLRSTLFENRKVNAGVQHYAFGINETVEFDAHPVYFVRLLDAAGRVLKEEKIDEASVANHAQPRHEEFAFRFALAKPVKKACFRVRLPDGTLVEEIMQRPYLPAGNFRFDLAFNHLYPPGTAFVARLESETGEVFQQQPVVPTVAK